MPDTPDTILVTASETAELAANRADLYVTVRGTGLFTGDEALKKAREVAQLVGELTALGLTQADIQLQAVYAGTASGTLLKTSQAAYHLKIHCARLDQLADVLGVVTAQKNAELTGLGWAYPESESLWDDLLRQAIARANAKARLIADGLGVVLRGVHTMHERQNREEVSETTLSDSVMGASGMRRSRTITSEDLGLAITHAKTLQVQVSVQYRVSEFAVS